MSKKFKIHTDVFARELNQETMLLHLSRGHYFGLNETGSFIWQQIELQKGSEEIIDAMAEKFSIDAVTAQCDFDELINELVEEQILA